MYTHVCPSKSVIFIDLALKTIIQIPNNNGEQNLAAVNMHVSDTPSYTVVSCNILFNK